MYSMLECEKFEIEKLILSLCTRTSKKKNDMFF
jgi:hypothetical protein